MQINIIYQGHVNGCNGTSICVWITSHDNISCIQIECETLEQALKLQHKHISFQVDMDKIRQVTNVFKVSINDVVNGSVIGGITSQL